MHPPSGAILLPENNEQRLSLTTETAYKASNRVLVLNQSYEPISVCGVHKAISLLFLAKADVVEIYTGHVLRSISVVIDYPSVIRLRRYVHIPIKSVELSRKNVMRRDNHQCQYCGTTKPPLTVDHIMPRSRGGQDTWENLVCACIKCNVKKGNRTPEEASVKLRTVPRRPSHVAFLKNLNGDIHDTWRPYLFM